MDSGDGQGNLGSGFVQRGPHWTLRGRRRCAAGEGNTDEGRTSAALAFHGKTDLLYRETTAGNVRLELADPG